MAAADKINELFRKVQQEASPALWSQGVTLTRGSGTFVRLRETDDECVIQLKIRGQSVSPKVTLWMEDLEWDCDCGHAESPCPHVAASVIAYKKGEVVASAAPASAGVPAASVTDELARLEYQFLRGPQGLAIDRYLVHGSKRVIFKNPLVGYLAGVKAHRIAGPDILALKADFQVEDALRGYAGGPLDRKRLENLFARFEDEQRVFLEATPVKVSSARIVMMFECVDEADGYRLRRAPNPQFTEIFPHGVILCTDTLKLVNATFLSDEEKSWFARGGSYWGPEREQQLATQTIPALKKKISLQIHSLKLPQTLELKPRVDLMMEKDRDSSGVSFLSVVANIVYGNPVVALLNYDTLQLVSPAHLPARGVRPAILRDQTEERQWMQRLAQELNLQPGRRVSFYGEEAIDFVRKAARWEVRGEGAAAFSPETRPLQAEVRVGDGDGELSFAVSFLPPGGGGSARVEFESVFRAWQQGAEHIPLVDGNWARIPGDWMNQFGKKIQAFLIAKGSGERVETQHLPELAELCEDLGQAFPDSLRELRGLLQDFRAIPDASLPADLTASLRTYQRKGVNWLCFLRQAKLGALLADDMGLGKTLQTLCALRGRSLIVAPTSVLFNWQQEIQRFRPGLKVNLYYGAKRQLDATADVTLTSYGLLRLDQVPLSAAGAWDCVVLDEAHTIKNPESQVARAAHALKGEFRVTLSGTPIENRLDDLWSQFQFLNPGLLGSRESFLEKCVRPIEAGDALAGQQLKKKIKPFILRRLKREVAPELPPKTENVLRCELNGGERALYEGLLLSTRKEVLENLEAGGGVVKALEVILRLRQACCHSALVPGQRAESSSKLDLLMETLDESLAEGHKSLIFSQWTSYLDLMERDLEKRGVAFSRIDGSTSKRQEVVNRFQTEGGPPVMLISLKAGGVGLNLTAADHVFIMDPWWNPAIEDQAADRAHRIGQQNPVLVHRLVALDTIEEKILLLQEKKKDLAKSVLDEGQSALGLTRQDLMDLLS